MQAEYAVVGMMEGGAMSDKVRKHQMEDGEPAAFVAQEVSRRQFLKTAGIADEIRKPASPGYR